MYFKQSLENYRENLKKSVKGPIHGNSWVIYFGKTKESSAGLFAWYPNREAFEKGLIDEVPSLNFKGSKKSWKKQRHALIEILTNTTNQQISREKTQYKVNQVLHKSGRIIWMGTYHDLKTSTWSMTEFIRRAFRGDEEELGEGHPIDADEDQGFKDYLLDYSAWESQKPMGMDYWDWDEEFDGAPEDVLEHLQSMFNHAKDVFPDWEIKQLEDDEDGHQVFSITGKLF